MAQILQIQIAEAQETVRSMNLDEKVALCDEIRIMQPTLLASVLVQSRLGTSNEELDNLIELLLVCYKSADIAGLKLRQITEADQELGLARVGGRAVFLEGLSPEMARKAYQDQVENHSEKYLLSFVAEKIRPLRVSKVETDSDKYFVMSALNLVETIAYVSGDA